MLAGIDAWMRARLEDRINSTFDPTTRRVWALESAGTQVVEMRLEPSGRTAVSRSIDGRGFALRDPRGLTVDPVTERLFVVDAGPRLVVLELQAEGGYRAAAVSEIDLPADASDLIGLAYDGASGHLHLLDRRSRKLLEISETGDIIATRDASDLGLDDAEGMIVGPTGDATDDPSEMSLYVVSAGRITEVSLGEPVFTAAATTTAVLVRTTQTSQFSPPSPDPSGLAYASHLGNLVMVDGEVDEMSIYRGANAYQTTLSGSLTDSWTTTAYSGEPVGTAYNPSNRHLFISDDNKNRVFEIDPGADRQYSTSDDVMTSFDTHAFGSDDSEGVAFDAARGVLFVVDGVNAQVYRVAPGANGVFDGVSPVGDDQVTSFDTQVHGLLDPEGIAFDSDLGQVYVVGKPTTLVFQFSPTGALLGTIDISAANARKPAGLEYVPAVSSARTLYIVDRGVDNATDPNENDGRLYQLSLPGSSGNTAPAVTVAAPSNGSSFTEGSAITFTGTASDVEDGNLTSVLTWSSSRDGAIGSGGTVTTSALSVGTHTITAAVTDAGGAQGSATITVTVNTVASGNTVQVRVAASTDDAEEATDGKMRLADGELQMVFWKTNQVVGLRFNNIAIPPGATITSASVQFQADQATSEATSLTIAGQAADNAATFANLSRNISSRARTTSRVTWSPAPWTIAGQAGASQMTPSLVPIIQEIVNRPGWQSGNSVAIIITGTGKRTAEGYDGLPAAAPLLRIEFAPTGANVAPTATNVSISGTPQVGRTLTGNYSYSDADGDAEGSSTYRWLRDGSPIGGATARTYVLGTADQGRLIAFEVTPMAASGANPGAPSRSPSVGPVTAATVNAAPTASAVNISGAAQVGQVLTGQYSYADADGDPEGTSTYRWLRNGAAIGGATGRSYTLVAADQGTLIRFEVTPIAASGASPGTPVQSGAIGPVAGTGTGTPTVVQVRVSASSDDAEESTTGSFFLTSSDLELVSEVTFDQLVGLRFNGLAIPRGATITSASVQFQVDETSSDPTSLIINGEATDNALVFSSTARISTRPRTASSAGWSPAPWTTVDEAGVNQRTSNIAAVIQEIVNRPGWQSGNSLALIITGTGRRIARAFDANPSAAPLLRIEYTVGPSSP